MRGNWKRRLVMYFIGLFIMTVGIAISVKSNLGVSPVSSIPYTLTCVWGIEMGKATILFHAVLVAIQIAILRRKFQVKNLLQIPVGVVFGYFTTFSNYLMAFAPDPHNLVLRLGMLLVSVVLVAVGIFLYLPANVMPLAGEGVMQAVSDTTHVPFPRVKMAFDVTMVAISLVTCLFFLRRLGSVGAGTVIAAVLVGLVLGRITKRFSHWRDALLEEVGPAAQPLRRS